MKRVLRSCLHSRRYNGRPLRLNQSPYRDFRLNPTNVPFSNVFIDYFGPYLVRKVTDQVDKVYIFCITCLWTRAINLKLSIDLTTAEFIRSFQLHVFEYGLSQLVLSDLGTLLLAGADIISNFHYYLVTRSYFSENNAKHISIQQYPKGCSSLGSLVESCVKLMKRLLSGSVGRNVLVFRDFEYFVCQTVHLVNRRPAAFRESLHDYTTDSLPVWITPELLIRGYNLLSVNIIPSLQSLDDLELDPNFDTDPISIIRDSNAKLRKV